MAHFAVGDIHGCYTALTTLIRELPWKAGDTFVFLGDYVDRGPNSKQVLDWLMTFSMETTVVCLKGNHEIMMERARTDTLALGHWLNFGGRETMSSFGVDPEPGWESAISRRYWDFIRLLNPWHETNETIYVHAGLMDGVRLNDQDDAVLYWRKFEVPEPYSDRRVICGHTSRKNGHIAHFGHTTCIDTYCYGGQWLTALEVESGTYLQANEQGDTRSGSILENF